MKRTADRLIRMARTSVRWSFNWADWSPTERDYRHAISCVQLEEKERLGRFVFRKDSRASLVGRLMMRKFVNEYCGVPYDKIIFLRDEHNRPILANETRFANFNVSHAGKFTVLAGELRDVKVGIDVMGLNYRGKDQSEFFRIMSRKCTPSEWSEIRGPPGTPDHEQAAMFNRHWALKESYIKAMGVGLVIDLGTLDFKTNSRLSVNKLVTDSILRIDGVKQNWLIEETMIDPEHCVAVSLQENEGVPKSFYQGFERLDFEKLVANAIPLHPEDAQYAKEYFSKAEKPFLG